MRSHHIPHHDWTIGILAVAAWIVAIGLAAALIALGDMAGQAVTGVFHVLTGGVS